MTIHLYDLIGADPSRPFSPHCWKATMAIAHKRLPYTREGVAFTKVGEIERGAASIVPVIRDGTSIVADSFMIADFLETTYPDRPSLFGGQGGQAAARFVESWSQLTLHPAIATIVLLELHDSLAIEDQAYFRASREARFGRSLEEVSSGRDTAIAEFATRLQPLRTMLKSQPFIGGTTPLFADYIVFGALQWARVASTARLIDPSDSVSTWFDRCLDLHDGLGRSVPAA